MLEVDVIYTLMVRKKGIGGYVRFVVVHLQGHGRARKRMIPSSQNVASTQAPVVKKCA